MFFLSRLSLSEEYHYVAWLKVFGSLFFFSLILNLAVWILILTQIGKFEADIPLHYNIYFGIDNFGSKNDLYFLPIFASIVLVINFLISLYSFFKEKMLTYFLVGGSILVQILALLASIAIILLNLYRL
ncbi:MAG: hypothetical protein JW816_03270 [Candidatus Buchananbacteria bacterium]|nr:hypothetical protein [Candidatus Buchananbacteria bacterium]